MNRIVKRFLLAMPNGALLLVSNPAEYPEAKVLGVRTWMSV